MKNDNWKWIASIIVIIGSIMTNNGWWLLTLVLIW